ncbi:saccharopine dehydrogenase [Lysobacter sp. HDW10]|uniref:saccharopine dehydrogenase family protein n=1 Tax=Lysobacter sp. HDW10 TaxID=2714936 RepID=UPI0014084B5D|nr:saccharopine dehydrogenase NADP-binding domain-containing protein [Lysobacter sp. HDW10]QIK80325.1 saccharopine dehydrogenase [Lysobacter sp. HDW10]
MTSSPTRVVVLGGYGLFGQRISARLAKDPSFHVSVAGRHPDKANDLIRTLDEDARSRCASVAIDTHASDFPARLAALSPHIVIDTAGPFQARDLRVPHAALQAGAHCIDLADGRDYVARIQTLDDLAKAKGLRVISGASSVPGLSAAVIAALAPSFERLDSVNVGISPGNHTPRGLATTEAILSYVGKPFSILEAGTSTTVHGWQSLRKVDFEGVGRRWFARCEVPDLDVLPALYPSLKNCDFRAGLELHRMHFGLWLASWVVRAGLMPSLATFAKPLLRISELWQTSGSDTGVMHIDLKGTDAQGNANGMRWEIIARQGDGPEIPATPAVVLAQKLARGDIKGGGASACANLFDLASLLSSLAPFKIETRTTQLTDL